MHLFDRGVGVQVIGIQELHVEVLAEQYGDCGLARTGHPSSPTPDPLPQTESAGLMELHGTALRRPDYRTRVPSGNTSGVPEGHIIHRLARELGQTIGASPVRASSPQGRFAAGAAQLDGSSLQRAEAWGKYLFCEFGTGDDPDDRVLHVHLGLIGQFRRRVSPPPEPLGAVRLRLEGEAATWDLSGPARCELMTPQKQAWIVGRLGPDPLRRNKGPGPIAESLARSRRPIGATLLDQSIVAGIGNVYRAELLFLGGIHPLRPSSEVAYQEIEGLWGRAVELMRIGRRLGRIVTTDPTEIGRPRGRMRSDERLYVYHRTHCRHCGSEIRTVAVGGRPCWFCATHQPD